MQLDLDLRATWGAFRLAVEGTHTLAGVTAFFGPSGSGKTTVLSALAGFRPGLGWIAIDGHVWQDARRAIPAHRRPVGMVFQDGRLFEHLDVAGNLDYAARRADRDGPAITRDAVIETLDLSDLLSRRASALSGGERQRIAIGRALLTRPRLMLMDEPLAALDRARKARILPLIRMLPERFGVPVLFVSHQLEEIVQIADNMIAIRDGAIVGDGPLAEMLDTLPPEVTGRFEAGTLLTGTVVEVSGTDSLVGIALGTDGPMLWHPDAGGSTAGDAVRIRLRARDVSLALSRIDGISTRNQLPCTIVAIAAEEGAYAEVRLDCAGQILRARITRSAIVDLGLTPGQEVWALVKAIAFDRRLGGL